MPLQAGILDRLALLRGVRSVENDHFLSEVYSGLPRTAGQRPAFGSAVSRLSGSKSAVPRTDAPRSASRSRAPST